ncbi:PCM1 [Bugula neritina]|uniref:PCM1 n=1 Tax=Bugula neritina TaxID=10212 RepID=A0A7J7KFV6_BUGNE|nr:PCM1 [Bugula neritina]
MKSLRLSFSPIFSLTLLTKQTGESKSTDTLEGNTKFFHEQLLSVLKDSLAKFEGRRMRDCGEDMLVEISEILFNELAFFK